MPGIVDADGGAASRFKKEGRMMAPVLHDVRAGFLLAVGLAMLALICAVAGLGAVMRPVRWSERKPSR